MRTILLVMAIIFLSPLAYAEERYIALGDVYIREAPPKPPFYSNAKEVGLVKKGEIVTLLDKTNVFFYEWLKIEIVRESKLVGWVYNGENNGTHYFEKVGGE